MNLVLRRFANLGSRFSAGEFLQLVIQAPDSDAPKNAQEAATRSVDAIKQAWPGFRIGLPATVLDEKLGCHVSGDGWSVTWKLPGYDEELEGFLTSISGASDTEALRLATTRKKREYHIERKQQ